MTRRAAIRWAASAAAGLLAGCSAFGDALSNEPNPGPCPRAFALYDAARKVTFDGPEELYSNIGFTAEIQGVRSLCRYQGDRPIIADLEVDFGFGRGPAAVGRRVDMNFFIAVTRKDLAVIHKESFPISATFPRGEDRVFVSERVDEITIPRASDSVSGTNFEILVGLELSDDELAFNRAGKRFLIDAGQAPEE